MKLTITFLAIVLISVLISGCTHSSQQPSYASPNQITSTPTVATLNHASTNQMTPIPASSKTTSSIKDDFSKTVSARVMVISKNWDSTPELDGIAIYPALLDANEKTITFDKIPLTVDIDIWSTKYDSKYNEVKDQIVYKGTGTILNWEEGSIFGTGIRVPFNEIKAPSDKKLGWTYITIHTPDGKSYSDVNKLTRLSAD